MDDQQCPQRQPGLTHVFDDGRVCDDCGVLREEPNIIVRLNGLLQEIMTPRVVKVSGEAVAEPAGKEERIDDGFWTVLNERERHAVLVERRYHESHQCDDR